MNKIVLILPYFGKLPLYWNLFWESCIKNKNIDFLIYTDCDVKPAENITVRNISWDAFKNKVQTNFDFKISLLRPYKLCDFKPAYGEIFNDDIKGYQYWGHCDCDLIWGDLNLLLPLIDKEYERIGIWGHLSLYQNNKEVNSYYRTLTSRNVPSYMQVFSNDRSFSFDEFRGMNILLSDNNINQCEDRLFDDIIFYSKTLFSRRKFNDFSPSYRTPQYFSYKDGHLFRHICRNKIWYKDESIYCHLQKRKMAILTTDLNSYYIVPNAFLPENTPIKEIKRLSKAPLIDFGYHKIILKSKLSKFIKRISGIWAN